MPKTILIVDDFGSSRDILGRTLEKAGYNVIKGSDGEDALSLLNGLVVDLIITDLNMPNMDGIDLIKNVRALSFYKFTPVMMLTTNTKAEKKELARKAGATAFLEKPFQVDTLLANIKRIIR